MADTRKVVKVFLASPGDLQTERRAAKSIVDELNSLWADLLGYQVELVGWEDTVSTYGRPQAVINRDLERCELFIGMMWKRWGTPPALTGPYTSGFEEEFSISVDNREKYGRPEVSLFFKDVDIGHKSAKVRRIAAKLLRQRRALDTETAERLKSDADVAVRFEAVRALLKGGRSFSDDEIKTLLVRPAATGTLAAVFGGHGTADQTFLTRFREQQLASMSIRELEQVADNSLIFDRAAEFALAERQYSTRGAKLRNSVEDQFKAEFAEKLERTAHLYGSAGGDLIEQIKSLEQYTRKEFTRKGLDIICRKGNPQDLGAGSQGPEEWLC